MQILVIVLLVIVGIVLFLLLGPYINSINQYKNKVGGLENKKILIIGGGPVGLTTALLLIMFGNNNITIVEQRARLYKRKQILLLDEHNVNLLQFITDLDFDKLCKVDLPPFDKNGYCSKNTPKYSNFILERSNNFKPGGVHELPILYTMPIGEVERVLYETLRKHSSKVTIYEPPNDLKVYTTYLKPSQFLITCQGGNFSEKNISSTIIEPEIVVAADGAGSKTALTFKNKKIKMYGTKPFDKNYGYVHIINQELPNKVVDTIIVGTNINNRKDFNRKFVQDCAQHRYRFFLGRDIRGGYAPSYLAVQFFPGEIKIANKKKNIPAIESIGNIKNALKNGVKFYGLPEYVNSEIDKINKDNISVLVPMRPSKRMYKVQTVDKLYIFYVGDSYINVNFYSGTGVNYGIYMAMELAKALNNSETIPHAVKNYENAVKKIDLDDSAHVHLVEKYNDNWGPMGVVYHSRTVLGIRSSVLCNRPGPTLYHNRNRETQKDEVYAFIKEKLSTSGRKEKIDRRKFLTDLRNLCILEQSLVDLPANLTYMDMIDAIERTINNQIKLFEKESSMINQKIRKLLEN